MSDASELKTILTGSAVLTTEPSGSPTSDPPPADGGQGGEGTPPAVEGSAPPAEPDGGTPPAGGDNGDGDGSPKDGDAPTGAPEAYADFTLPDGVTVDQELLTEFQAIAKEKNLPQEEAQKFVTMGAKIAQRTVERLFEAHETRKTEWLEAAKADPEIGEDVALGEKSAAIRAFNTITGGSEAAKEMVNELGIGNHPEFIRVFHRISKLMGEDTFHIPGTGGTGGMQQKLDARYPNTK